MLSEELRRGTSSALMRSRMLAGACCAQLAFGLVATGVMPDLTSRLTSIFFTLSSVGVLVMTRRARSSRAPAVVLCASGLLGSMAMAVCVRGLPYAGTHVGFVLPLVLAVYLVGPRLGLFLLLLLSGGMGVLHPLLSLRFSAGSPLPPGEFFWPLHVLAIASFVGVWLLGVLHGTARDEAQRSLEQALKHLAERESQLTSVIESTTDLVCSLDIEGRTITANAASRRASLMSFGREPVVGEPYFPLEDVRRRELWAPRMARARSGEHARYEDSLELRGTRLTFETHVHPIVDAEGQVTGVTIFARDITAQKEAEARLGEMHRTLVDVSRQAGMAEIATGVLHNVGNTLNSINVSTGEIANQLRKSRITGLAKATGLLREHASELGAFLTTDPQGQKLPLYLSALSDQLHAERDAVLREVDALNKSVEHIRSIINMQQRHARTAATLEQVAVPQLIDEAMRLHAVSFERLGIAIERQYAEVPPLLVDRHKLLQILINLLGNARHALMASERQDRRLTLRVQPAADGQRLLIEVADNGVGIAPENLPRMFTRGFTTKQSGHGFGLHISALSATEMRGKLSCSSAGPGQGATFTLELPMGEAPTG